MSGRVCSLAEAAATIGLSQVTLKSWINRGMPARRAKNGRDWQIGMADLLTWREQQVAAAMARSGSGPDGPITKEEASRRSAVASMTIKELEAAERRGELVRPEELMKPVED